MLQMKMKNHLNMYLKIMKLYMMKIIFLRKKHFHHIYLN